MLTSFTTLLAIIVLGLGTTVLVLLTMKAFQKRDATLIVFAILVDTTALWLYAHILQAVAPYL